MSIREGMPLLARHAGEWTGVYTHVDNDGAVIDQHQSHLICAFPEGGAWDYFQTNHYQWADGRKESFDFPAKYSDGRIWWDTDRIEGSAWEIDQKTIVLHWSRKDIAGSSLYEMIQLSDCGNHRARTWHWFKDDRIFKRTLIKEERLK